MNCHDCTRAKVNPTIDAFMPHCESCMARALASTGAHLESAAAGAMTPQYRSALQTLFAERWLQGHEMVKEWSERITAAARAKASAEIFR